MIPTNCIHLFLTFLALPTLCDCFATTELLVLLGAPLQGTRFHDTITKAAVCKAQYDWLARNTKNLHGLQPPNPLAYQPCPYANWGISLIRSFLLADLALQDFALNSFKPDIDAATKDDPRYHFDSDLMINETNVRLIAARQEIVNMLQASSPNYIDVRAAIASSFHTVQDFYSHTNWIEMNNTVPNPHIAMDTDLGIPIAPPSMPTCSDCSRDTMTPEQIQEANDWESNLANGIYEALGMNYDPANVFICKDNILNTGYLTSGFYANEALAPKIASQMKCSHGGGSDSSSNITATGGINKDTNTFLYSPHYDFHFAAADVAVQATINYLDGIRTAVNDDAKFGRLLGMRL